MMTLYRLLALPLTIILLSSTSAFANDALLVKGVQVDISADSALSARNKAFAEARRKAYEHIASRNLPEGSLATLSIPDDAVLASMVRDFEIENEKMTSRRYVGTFNVRFSPNVRRSFAAAAAPTQTLPTDTQTLRPADATAQGHSADRYAVERNLVYSPARSNTQSTRQQPRPVTQANVQTQARPVLVLPWYGVRGRQTIWGAENPWRAAWESQSTLLQDTAMPVLLPVGDVDDVRDYAPPQPLSAQGDIPALMRRYNVSDAVLALAEPAEAGAVVVSLFRIEGATPVAMGRFGVDAGAGRDSLTQAVTRTVESLRAMPRNEPTQTNTNAPQQAAYQPYMPMGGTATAPAPTGQQFQNAATQLIVLARFSGLQQWVQMRNALSATPGVGALDILSISPAQAQLQFNYAGDSQNINSVLAQSGLQLVPLTAMGNASNVPGVSAPTHQLTQTRSF